MIYSIYTITNKHNGKVYVGFTQDCVKRWQAHINDSKYKSKILYESFKKHGIENFCFEVVYQSKDREHTLIIMEPFFIEMYDSYNKGYNANRGGYNTNTEELKKKNSERMKTSNPMKILRVNKGSFQKGHKPKITEERNKKISLSKQGSKNPNYGNKDTSQHLNKYVTCNKCGKSTNLGNAKRWHFEKCRYSKPLHGYYMDDCKKIN